jgi:hypothetical protein
VCVCVGEISHYQNKKDVILASILGWTRHSACAFRRSDRRRQKRVTRKTKPLLSSSQKEFSGEWEDFFLFLVVVVNDPRWFGRKFYNYHYIAIIISHYTYNIRLMRSLMMNFIILSNYHLIFFIMISDRPSLSTA